MSESIYERFGVHKVINASGKMTNLGGSVLSARALATRLAAGSPSIRVRGHQASTGTILLDPRELPPGAEELIAQRVREIVSTLG